jgi:hypothetical protein
MPQYDNQAYTSHLTPKFFLGGTYNITEKINVGLLARGEVFQNKLHSSLTISGNTNFKKWFSASLSYSIMNNIITLSTISITIGSIFIMWTMIYYQKKEI